MKQSIIFLILTFITSILFAQGREFKFRVNIPSNSTIYKEVTIPNGENILLNVNDIVTREKKYSIDGTEYTSTLYDTINTPTTITAIKKTTTTGNLPGKANIYLDKDDPSKIRINYFLGDAYDREGKYFIKLKNRESMKFTFITGEIGALTIPFKIRPGITNEIKSLDAFIQSDVNLNTYIGISRGYIRYWHRSGMDTQIDRISGSCGLILGFSSQKLDATSSSLEYQPYSGSIDILIATYGIGIYTTFYDFKIGIFGGVDMSHGPIARKWNYDRQPWYGFGVGYNLGFLKGKI